MGGVDARTALARAESWRPFRAYALFHLWVSAAYSG
jgi:DNA-3-methyladenine glycosylase II/AraC family transcriptional regulator of adaptative response / DNA-3-methyladenine glycosylase II